MKAMTPEFFKERGSTGFASFSVTATDRYYVALRADIMADDRVGRDPYQTAYWSYSWIVLGRSLGRMPLWLSRGLAEVMSNTVVTERSLHVGMILVSSLETLRDRGRIRFPEFLAVDSDSPWYTDGRGSMSSMRRPGPSSTTSCLATRPRDVSSSTMLSRTSVFVSPQFGRSRVHFCTWTPTGTISEFFSHSRGKVR